MRASLCAYDGFAVERGSGEDTLNFRCQLAKLRVQRVLVGIAVGRISSLHREFPHPLQRIGRIDERTFRCLSEGYSIVGVANRNLHPALLGVHSLRNREASGVIFCAVDTQTGGKTLSSLRQT